MPQTSSAPSHEQGSHKSGQADTPEGRGKCHTNRSAPSSFGQFKRIMAQLLRNAAILISDLNNYHSTSANVLLRGTGLVRRTTAMGLR
jgi:hypothetical protein